MYKLYTTKTFDRKIKGFIKKHPELENTIKQKLDSLIQNPFEIKLKTHKLTGKLKNEWVISLTYEYRILFVLKEDKIFLTNIGSHDEVY